MKFYMVCPSQCLDEALSKDFVLPFGKAKIEREGSHVTVVCAGRATDTALHAAAQLVGKGKNKLKILFKDISGFNLCPWALALKNPLSQPNQNQSTFRKGVWPQSGIGAEICARVMESPAFFELDAPAWRVTGADVPMPYARSLEAAALPRPEHVVHAAAAVLGNA
ncbi:hypothetical protein ACJJTC_009270 [Scirpophaga incertulas]